MTARRDQPGSADRPTEMAAPGSCAGCGSPVEPTQRYCLECGEHVGPRDPQLEQLLARARAPSGEEAPAVAAAAATAAGSSSRVAGLSLPGPWVSGLLVLLLLGFGVIVGSATGPRSADTLDASARGPLRVVLPQTASAPEASAPAAAETPLSESSPASASETPVAAAQPAASAASAPASVPASTAAPAASTPSASSGTTEALGGSPSGSSGASSGGSSKGVATKLPPVKHVFVIVLSDQPYASVFGPSSGAPYLSRTLEQRGELLVRYDAVAHEQLANGVALISGQGPTVASAANCPTYGDIAPATTGVDGQVIGNGCVYPRSTETLPGQLSAKHLGWRAYVQGMDEGPGQAPACARPALGQPDPTALGQQPPGQAYATFRNPFVYFHSLTDTAACAANDVGVKRLPGDLAKATRAPSLAYIVPDRCHDAAPTPCAPGAPAGLGPADAFLKQVVPEILSSKPYKQDGLLVITVDEAPSSGSFADSSACCGQPRFPNLPASGSALIPKGGGEVGALLLSPFVKPGAISQEPLNHFSLLRTIEDLFGLKHLGYAAAAGVSSFEPSLFTARKSG